MTVMSDETTTSIKRIAFECSRFLARCVSAVLSTLIISYRLLANLPRILRSDVLLVYPQGGFGHTIHGPDLVRRLFLGKRIVVLHIFLRTVHNPLVSRIWPDVHLVFMPVEFAWGTVPN